MTNRVYNRPTPRQDIKALQAALVVAEAEQKARNLTKAAPNGKEKYHGNGQHTWEEVTLNTRRLRVPGGWLYAVSYYESSNDAIAFVPLPAAIGYAV